MFPVGLATYADREWGAKMMAASEPWLTLRRSYAQCCAVIFDPRFHVFIARDAGRPIAFAIVDPQGFAGAPYLKSIAVDQEHRGLGVGSALLRHVESEYRSRGQLFLCVSSFNPRARALYQREGFTAVADLANFVVPGASELIMRKCLH